MSKLPLSATERARYRAGGFRLEGRRQSAAAFKRARLETAVSILGALGAGPRAIRATLALPSSKTLASWRRGKAAIAPATAERIAIVLALYDRLLEIGDRPRLKPLPALKRPGRKSLAGREVLAAGRLSDLLALWRQLVLAEEAAAAAAKRGRRS